MRLLSRATSLGEASSWKTMSVHAPGLEPVAGVEILGLQLAVEHTAVFQSAKAVAGMGW